MSTCLSQGFAATQENNVHGISVCQVIDWRHETKVNKVYIDRHKDIKIETNKNKYEPQAPEGVQGIASD